MHASLKWGDLKFDEHPNERLFSGDPEQHVPENEIMEWQHQVPIDPAPNASWPEGRRLFEQAAAFILDNGKLQPGFSGEFHLGKEQESVVLVVGEQHPPEIEGIAGLNVDFATATPHESDTPHELIDASTDPPQSISVIPSLISTDAKKPLSHLVGFVFLDLNPLAVFETSIDGNFDVLLNVEMGEAAGRCIFPARDDHILLDL